MKFRKFFDYHLIMRFFLFSGIVVFNIANVNKTNSSQQREIDIQDIKLTNKTSGFRISSIEKAGRHIQLIFANEYKKAITGFQASIGKTQITEEFSVNEKSFIPPGAKFTKIYAIQPMMVEKGVSILAVFFEDGTADGDPVYIRKLNEIRAGRAKIFDYFLPQIQSAIDSPDSELAKAFYNLKNKVSSFYTNDESKGYYEYGIQEGLQDLLEEINNIEHNASIGIRANLKTLKERYQKLFVRLNIKHPASTN